MRLHRLVPLLAALAVAPLPAHAAYTLVRAQVVPAATAGATAPPYRLSATVSELTAGQMAGGDYGLWAGFLWPHAAPTAGVDDAPAAITRLAWRPARPNPALGRTTLTFDLPATADARVSVYSVDGRRVATPFAGRRDAGRHSFTWDCRDGGGRRLAPGVYLVVLETGSRSLTQRLVVLDH